MGSCKENTLKQGTPKTNLTKIREFEISEFDKNHTENSFGFFVGDNKLIFNNDSNDNTNRFKFDNDKFLKNSDDFNHEMSNSMKGLYFNLDSNNASIYCQTYLGEFFNIKYKPETNTIINFVYRGNKIFLNKLTEQKIIVKEMKENGTFDSIVYVPLSKKNIKNSLWSGGLDSLP